ncbi:MAG: glutamate-1-semialdehyde 2,1-aminomutase [Candidatus Eisenbacteria bacterium]|uniref:Glutamate-1-semialdehyde 2,1-aminomutase n=1 Tax=Eiseniibacteriota bacterium TaxID=2212470 RepID=A0A7Y2E5L3_UNCEI|nr:glutamate-1-semialdehyde 2,1-aminomutase [Candidatus Eisenbacteria bacterium]
MSTNEQLFDQAQRIIPGGVNSPVRAFGSVGGTPRFISRAEGAYVWDAEGKRYLDFVGSWGPMILGHANPVVVAAVQEQSQHGLSFGAPTELETYLAKEIIERIPSVEQVRLVNSGTEATMAALRLARAFTGREAFVKIEGCYHGHGDAFLVQAGSGATTLGIPNSPGVPESVVSKTLLAPFNDLGAVEGLFKEHPGEISCVFLEPIAGNMGLILPAPDYLSGLRRLCDQYGALLVFDEVMTGFRVARGGAQSIYDVRPDLTTLGKIVGGGMPIGAYGGRDDIMSHMAPKGPVYQAGTLSGNPIAVRAGLETLKQLDDEAYEKLESLGRYVESGVLGAIERKGLPLSFQRSGSMFGLFFRSEHVRNYEDAKGCDTTRFAKYFHAMLERGFYLAPSQFEAGFLSLAHSESDLAGYLEQSEEVLSGVFA